MEVDLGAGTKLALVLVPQGTFVEGSGAKEPGRGTDEQPRRVTLSADFYIGRYPVTRGQFARFVAASHYVTEAEKGKSGGFGFDGKAGLVQRPGFNWRNPGFPQTDDHPVTLVTFADALAFTDWLTRTAGRGFVLPTEAQWEYAYRAGTTTPFYVDSKTPIGWFKKNAGNGTRSVGTLPLNGFGLGDMAGNVYEWCLDWYAQRTGDPVVDPIADMPETPNEPRRVLRGGSWLRPETTGRAAARYRNTPGSRNADNGFRVVTLETEPLAAIPQGPPSSPLPMAKAERPGLSMRSVAVVAASLWSLGVMVSILVVVLRHRKKKMPLIAQAAAPVRFTPGADGFWVHGPARAAGSKLSYRFRTQDSQIHYGEIELDPSPRGQFVYTGVQPTSIDLVSLGAVAGFAAAVARPQQAVRPPRQASAFNRDYSTY